MTVYHLEVDTHYATFEEDQKDRNWSTLSSDKNKLMTGSITKADVGVKNDLILLF